MWIPSTVADVPQRNCRGFRRRRASAAAGSRWLGRSWDAAAGQKGRPIRHDAPAKRSGKSVSCALQLRGHAALEAQAMQSTLSSIEAPRRAVRDRDRRSLPYARAEATLAWGRDRGGAAAARNEQLRGKILPRHARRTVQAFSGCGPGSNIAFIASSYSRQHWL